MLTTHFFADPDFLEMLLFWDASRGSRSLPDWSGDLAVVPRTLLPNLIISDRRGEATYRYVGAECIRRFGSDPTGKPAYGDILRGAHARYLQSVSEEALTRRAPIFSAAVYQPDPANLIMSGRLHTPFTYRGSAGPNFIFAVQLFKGSDRVVARTEGFVHEIRRDLIAQIPELHSRLEDARRAYQISRH
ncbi:MAG: hypothetical protein HY060_03340, partial [Proteobacteria bacterium]|nr:hypothetical protein [Pseudomonadota bacterium]